jgi:ferredoxin
MIIGKLKPLEEIGSSVSEFNNILILACGSCVTVCLSGGDREARVLARQLSQNGYHRGRPQSVKINTFLRQCEPDLLRAHLEIPESTEAVLSLACGAGVQTVASVFTNLPVFPALNTTFLGALDEPGLWREKCRGCGDCLLSYTGGICPVTRCAKKILNGPCGGSSKGKCEINKELDCAWHLIVDRLKTLGRLGDYEKLMAIKDWSADTAGGPRSYRRSANDEVSSH